MKQFFFLLALPFAFWTAQPLFDGPELRNDRHPEHGMAIHHTPPPALMPQEFLHAAMAREAKSLDLPVRAHAYHEEAAQLHLTTLQMAKTAISMAGANDDDMDLSFNLEYGLSDLTVNKASADDDMGADFNLEHGLSDFSGYTPNADEQISSDFAGEQAMTVKISLSEATASDLEIGQQFGQETK